MFSAILSALVGIITGVAMTYGYVETQRIFGKQGADKLRRYATELERIISKNSQYLADWKAANENKKAALLNSIIGSIGYGPRLDSLRAEYAKRVEKDKTVTSEVEEKNAAATAKANAARQGAAEADQSISAGIQAGSAQPGDPYEYEYAPNSQNVNGGSNTNRSDKENYQHDQQEIQKQGPGSLSWVQR